MIRDDETPNVKGVSGQIEGSEQGELVFEGETDSLPAIRNLTAWKVMKTRATTKMTPPKQAQTPSSQGGSSTRKARNKK